MQKQRKVENKTAEIDLKSNESIIPNEKHPIPAGKEARKVAWAGSNFGQTTQISNQAEKKDQQLRSSSGGRNIRQAVETTHTAKNSLQPAV